MAIKAQRDFWCGLVFLAIGVAFLILAREYRVGTAARMGPGYFPTLLGGLLALLGVAISGAALVGPGERFPRLQLRPLLVILASIVAFGLALEPLGFVIAVTLLVVIGGFADPELRLRESVALAAFMVVFSVGVFYALLGLPLTLWPNL
jgi:putative tricarboxylic transport membrane protein